MKPLQLFLLLITLGIYYPTQGALTLPTAPVGSISVGTNPTCVAVSRGFAYVGSYNSKMLQIVDVHTPTNPIIVGSVTTAGSPSALTVVGHIVYLLYQYSTTLDVIDVS